MNNFSNLTQTELENELKQDYAGSRELDNLVYDKFMKNVIEKIEKRRKEFRKVSPIYTQEYLAKKAGISFSTYKNYLSGNNNGFSLRTLKKIADTLNCHPSDFLEPSP